MKKIIYLLIVLILYFFSYSYAEISLKAEVDKTNLTTDEVITYKLIIVSSEKKPPNLKVPSFDSFNVLSQVQSSRVSFDKEDVKTTLEYIYILSPLKTGKITVEPSLVMFKDETYLSDSFEVEVKQGERKKKAFPGSESSDKPKSGSGAPQFIL